MPETLVLRPDQAELIGRTRDAFNEGHDQVILQAPTGFGKTTMFTHMALTAQSLGFSCHVFAHLNELLDQIAARFDRYGLAYGLMKDGQHIRPEEPVQICSIQTYRRRLERIVRPDMVIFDEAHHCVARSYQDVVTRSREEGAHVLGVTATPMRGDGIGLGAAGYTKMVCGPTPKQLIAAGDMVPFRIFTRPNALINLNRKTDYSTAEAEKIAEDADIFGCTVDEYQRVAMGTLAVAFYASVRHAKLGAEAFNAAGIPAAVLYGDMPKDERKSLFQDFIRRNILVLCNCNLISEGVDVPGIETVIFAKPSNSHTHWLQGAGRASRPNRSEGKEFCTLIDQVGLFDKFGSPTRDVEWSLDSTAKLGEDEKLKQCKWCLRWIPQNAGKCPECNASFAAGGAGNGRQLTTADGQLLLVTDEYYVAPKIDKKKELQKLISKAESYEELVAIGIERGFDPKWASVTWRRKQELKRKWGR